MRVERDWRGIGEGTDGGARGKRGLFGKEDGGMDGEIVRDMEGDERMNGASRFWETVPKAGRFFCAIVGL